MISSYRPIPFSSWLSHLQYLAEPVWIRLLNLLSFFSLLGSIIIHLNLRRAITPLKRAKRITKQQSLRAAVEWTENRIWIGRCFPEATQARKPLRKDQAISSGRLRLTPQGYLILSKSNNTQDTPKGTLTETILTLQGGIFLSCYTRWIKFC